MHPDISKLLQVQKVDDKFARVRRAWKSLPVEEERRRLRAEQVRQNGERAKAELDQSEVESRTHEKSILAADQELEKLTGRLNAVKNNAEYQATLFQIESVKKERGEIEEEGLAVLERLDGLRTAAEAAAAQLTEEEASFAEFQQEASKLRSELEGELAEFDKARKVLLADIPSGLLEKYETLFETRDGSAVCLVEGEVCTGCYTRVTPNDIARLLGAGTIVHCGSCQRILYMLQD